MKLLGSILSVLLFAATTFAEAPAGKIAAALQPFVDDSALAGAVTLVADKDKILDLEAVGYRDVAAKDPMASDDLFWIASQSKGITAAGLMILVDEGKVKVNKMPDLRESVTQRCDKRVDYLYHTLTKSRGVTHRSPAL